jgi:hypothetical protein
MPARIASSALRPLQRHTYTVEHSVSYQRAFRYRYGYGDGNAPEELKIW